MLTFTRHSLTVRRCRCRLSFRFISLTFTHSDTCRCWRVVKQKWRKTCLDLKLTLELNTFHDQTLNVLHVSQSRLNQKYNLTDPLFRLCCFHFRHQQKFEKLASERLCKFKLKILRSWQPLHQKFQHRSFSRHCSPRSVPKRMDQRWVR